MVRREPWSLSPLALTPTTASMILYLGAPRELPDPETAVENPSELIQGLTSATSFASPAIRPIRRG